MPTASYSTTSDISFGPGTRSFSFNLAGDVAGAETDTFRFSFLLDYNNGAKVDLGDVTIYFRSPEGRTLPVYVNFDGFGDDDDDGEDSDSANDYDIYFNGTDSKSRITTFFDGQAVPGNWQLIVDNDTGRTLTLDYLYAYADYSAPDIAVEDIRISGTQAVGETVTITADLRNIGERYVGPFRIEYLVNDEVVGTGNYSGGLLAGQSYPDILRYRIEEEGANTVSVRVIEAEDDGFTANNTRTETFIATEELAPDIIVRDIGIEGVAQPGEEVRLTALLENIGAEYAGPFRIEYWVNGVEVGDDRLNGGLLAGQEWTERFTYTVEEDVLDRRDHMQVEVRVFGNSDDRDHSNDNRTEWLGVSRRDETDKTLANSSEAVEAAAFFARAIYGDGDMPNALNGDNDDNGRDDDYETYLGQMGWSLLDEDGLGLHFIGDNDTRWQDGGLYEGRFSGGILNSQWEAQGLVATATLEDGSKALMLAFRGTDSKDLGASIAGQAWTGDGLYEHYSAHRPLIEAALSYANDSANGIDKMIVTGHSLGGSMVDIFSSMDAQRLRPSVDLTAVAFGAAGVKGTVYTHTAAFKGFEAEYDRAIVRDLGSDDIRLSVPSYYIGISHGQDSVTFAERIDNGFFRGFVPNATLENNVNFDRGIYEFNLPSIRNSDLDTGSTPTHGFGAEHNVGLYWANAAGLARDALAEYHDGERIFLGRDTYGAVKEPNDTTFGVFTGYTNDPAGYQNDQGDHELLGRSGDEYLLGLGGDDTIQGLSGNDLVSGGPGNDLVKGNSGNDHVHGGAHNDRVIGGGGADVVGGGNGADLARLGPGADRYYDTLLPGRDKVFGGGGRDEIDGGGGNDKLYGGGGSDRINGGTEADKVTGGKGRDFVDLGQGNDRWIDTAQGGKAGGDRIEGGGGADTFVLSALPGKDIILDYETGVDALRFPRALIDSDPTGEAVVAEHGSLRGGSVLFAFGDGQTLRLRGVETLDGLAEDISVF